MAHRRQPFKQQVHVQLLNPEEGDLAEVHDLSEARETSERHRVKGVLTGSDMITASDEAGRWNAWREKAYPQQATFEDFDGHQTVRGILRENAGKLIAASILVIGGYAMLNGPKNFAHNIGGITEWIKRGGEELDTPSSDNVELSPSATSAPFEPLGTPEEREGGPDHLVLENPPEEYPG